MSPDEEAIGESKSEQIKNHFRSGPPWAPTPPQLWAKTGPALDAKLPLQRTHLSNHFI